MSRREFAELAIRLRGAPFSFAERPYLRAIYESTARNVMIRASRQVEKSTFLVNRMLHSAVTKPGVQILFVCPRREQSRLFSKSRLRPAVSDSPVLRRLLWPHRRQLPTENIEFKNGSQVFVRAAFLSADAIRGISADELYVDEYQDLAPGELPVLQETLSHATHPQTILTGTPKMIDNPLEAAFNHSTAQEWHVACAGCGSANLMDDRVLGATETYCRTCQLPLDVSRGHWVPRNPTSVWGDGFWVNHLMVPWLNHPEILERQKTYDPTRFCNEVLGLPTDLGDHIITREEIEACCENFPFASDRKDVVPARRPALIAGIDWGGGSVSGTVLAIGYLERDMRFRVVRFCRWRPHAEPNEIVAELAQLIKRFGINWIAADGGGNGLVYNRLLLQEVRKFNSEAQLYSILYSSADQPPVRQGALWQWTVNRSSSIGNLFSRVKTRLLRFPRVADSSSYLDEFTCELVEYDEVMRTVRYTKPDNLRDDALHATNYAQLLGLRMPIELRE